MLAITFLTASFFLSFFSLLSSAFNSNISPTKVYTHLEKCTVNLFLLNKIVHSKWIQASPDNRNSWVMNFLIHEFPKKTKCRFTLLMHKQLMLIYTLFSSGEIFRVRHLGRISLKPIQLKANKYSALTKIIFPVHDNTPAMLRCTITLEGQDPGYGINSKMQSRTKVFCTK